MLQCSILWVACALILWWARKRWDNILGKCGGGQTAPARNLGIQLDTPFSLPLLSPISCPVLCLSLGNPFFPSQTWAIVFDHQGHLHLSFPGLPENLPEWSFCIIQFSLSLCCCRFHSYFPKCKSISENHDSDLELLLEMLLRHQMYSYRSAATHRQSSAGMLISRPWTHLCTGFLAGFVNKGPALFFPSLSFCYWT